jgi:hypothetical protein
VISSKYGYVMLSYVVLSYEYELVVLSRPYATALVSPDVALVIGLM